MMKRLTRWALALVGAIAFAGTALAESGAAGGNELQSINVARQAGTVIVKLGLKQPLPMVPTSFAITSPARIVVDLPATTNRLGRNLQTFNEAGLRSANFVQTPEKMRLVLNLSQSMTHSMRLDGDALLITLEPFAVDAAAASQVANFAPERLSAAHAVRDIAFRRGADGEARIAVELSDVGAGIDIRQSGSTLIVDFARTKLPDHLKRRVDVTDFGTPVTNWSAMQQGETARLSISPKGLWEHSAYQTDTRFVIEVKPIVENPNKLVQGSRGGYQGEKLSLNFQNVDVRPLLQVIGEFTGMNVVVSDTVSGSLTLILKDVPWDQALDIILQQRGLDMRKNGNVIRSRRATRSPPRKSSNSSRASRSATSNRCARKVSSSTTTRPRRSSISSRTRIRPSFRSAAR
jgi:type IV pilus assembly protein PilQ